MTEVSTTIPPSMTEAALQASTLRKISYRLLPLMAFMYLACGLDRINVAFAALTMNRDIGLSPIEYAFGSGAFFFTYFLFEVPSNLILDKVGARVWMVRIMLTWGLISGLMAFIVGFKSFVAVRLLLGAAEAGFIPGMLLYITQWFPAAFRARAVAVFFLAAPLANALSGVLSVPLLQMDGTLGLTGWQWMFLVEAVPTFVLAAVAWVYLKDGPRQAGWLSSEECNWLERRLQSERNVKSGTDGEHKLRVLLSPRTTILCLIYFFRAIPLYGVSLFLPQVIKAMGLTNAQVGWAGAIPFIAATVVSVVWARSSDRTGERHWHTAAAIFCAAAGLVLSAYSTSPLLGMIGLSMAASGVFSQAVCFWAIPPAVLSVVGAAAGIAAINAVGNLGGFFGPYIVGWAAQATGNFQLGLYIMAGSAVLSGVLSLSISRLGWERAGPAVAAH